MTPWDDPTATHHEPCPVCGNHRWMGHRAGCDEADWPADEEDEVSAIVAAMSIWLAAHDGANK